MSQNTEHKCDCAEIYLDVENTSKSTKATADPWCKSSTMYRSV